MPFYPDDVIQQLKSQAYISLVIQQFLPLKRSGTNRFVGVCPFHDDHSPSMTVNPTLGIYKCFACGAGGDVFKFVQEHEKIDFNGAVEWVANFVGFSLPKFASKENAEVQEEKGMIRKLNELACNWFEQQLSLSEKALEYLAKRNISEQTRKQFHIGYAPDKREGLIAYAAKNGFSPKDCLRAGLAVEKKNGGIDDKFRDRLMIAIQNQSGTVVAFGGRDLAPKQEGFERPKYMNSPETPLYNKSEILFGLNHSRTAIAKENAVIIVEGYFDLISLYQGGVQNVVAASGTALTEFHANILARYAKTAYLVFDGDEAGRKATHRTIEIVLPKGIVPRIFALSRPDGTKIDPDNFVNEQGAEAFREQLKGAEDWLSYLSHNSDLQGIEDRAKFITYVKSVVKSIQDKELQNQYVELIAERFNTKPTLEGIQGIRPQKKPKAPAPQAPQDTAEYAEYGEVPQQSAEPERVPWELLSPLEVRFANLLVRNPTLLDRACEYFDVELAASGIQIFESSIIDEFVNTVIADYTETGYFSPQTLYEQLSPLLKQFMENL
ncbi:MAG: DNA primase, partial [Fibrobacter sp.]|nr:DNA primase [Fibrobacter sp.]